MQMHMTVILCVVIKLTGAIAEDLQQSVYKGGSLHNLPPH
jgi:hypothetical protein